MLLKSPKFSIFHPSIILWKIHPKWTCCWHTFKTGDCADICFFAQSLQSKIISKCLSHNSHYYYYVKKNKKLFTDSFTNLLCYIFPVSVSLVFLSLGEVILIRAEENSTCGQSSSRADIARLLSSASAVNAISASPLPNALHHYLALSLAS